MSKYALSLGVVWIIISVIIGLTIFLLPSANKRLSRLQRIQAQNSSLRDVAIDTNSNVAPTKVRVAGTPTEPPKTAETSVTIIPKSAPEQR